MNIVRLTLLTTVVMLLLIGCKQQNNTDAPPEILYGQDVCDRCGMIISEETMAAAYWTTSSEAYRFDDIGGMIAHQQENGDEIASWWVHDVNSAEWIRAEEAHFVMGAELMTPMGFGIVALADKDAADALAYGVEGAMVLDFASLQSQLPMPNGMNGMME